ncbi:lysM and putative peptidoglycan-binding domain-containing protein 3-like [Ylistrum balloti]|uniref:lysM and putative peptidoglycan-binding domain-containing protein 3-like n=1 Tax=Ylistrum balloti TaxID=509963 RepID=UPI002905C9A9|nr:lysM and putative peptidoglycan-binding domain-containing protein 3-like [Ylistrum balloti]
MSNGHLRPSSRGGLFGKKNEDYVYSGAQVQNVKKNRVYVFGDADVADDEVVEFEMEMRSRKAPRVVDPKEKEPIYFEREITEGDSLRSLALQYGCPVSELKRINNFIQDQDFYGYKVVKVPMKRHSFLTEHIEKEKEEQARQQSSTALSNGMTVVDETCESSHDLMENTDNDSICDMSDPETQNLIIRTLSISDALNSQSRDAQKFLDNMDKDLSKIRQANDRTNRRSLDEVVSMLTNRTIRPFPKNRNKTDGANWGMSWKSLVIGLIALAVICPVIFFLYVRYS